MLNTSNSTHSSFISRSASMPLLTTPGESILAQGSVGKTTVGRRIQQTETPQLSWLTTLKNSFFNLLSCLKRQRKVATVQAGKTESALDLLRAEFEQKSTKQEEKINTLEQAYEKNHRDIQRNLRTILSLSSTLSDLQQQFKTLQLGNLNRSEQFEQQTLMAGHGQHLTVAPQALALTAGFQQRALMSAPQPLALTAGESVAEQLLGNPYNLLAQSARANAMAAQGSVIRLQIPRQDVDPVPALQQAPRTAAEKLATAQAEAKKVISNPSSTQTERSAAQATVMQAAREAKVHKKIANSRRIQKKNDLKKNN